ncbi:hypothetical protein NIIDMKKI_09170 [Mycobacterium kansasii]|uniref:Uncharacterized protein n=1 Tax=Mycobacterium kansasii TaxID=1768 RepID=A0A7G1I3X5_MYCKA|nr:hypothetical protein NIIDMKKI_09170 [Mycobacterium kansasii]
MTQRNEVAGALGRHNARYPCGSQRVTFGQAPVEISATTSVEVRKAPAATAVRRVADFSVTSTMCAAPRSSRCDNPPDWKSDAVAIGGVLPVDDRHRMEVREVIGGQRERQLAEG